MSSVPEKSRDCFSLVSRTDQLALGVKLLELEADCSLKLVRR
jgi:hypothetical protein